MKISLSQFKRFEKQIILKKIGLAGQKRIFSANVLIVGISPQMRYPKIIAKTNAKYFRGVTRETSENL